MVLVSASVDVYLFTAIAVTLPVVFYLRQRNSSSRPETPYEPYLTILVGLHTLYILYNLILCWPLNLFSRLHIPLNASPDTIRSTIIRRAGLDTHAPLPRSLENLLTRLSSFEMRTLYVRFGQAVLQECEHCKTFDDYALFALPRALAEYVCEVAVVGLLTIHRTGRERWRTYIVGALICAAVTETYWIITATVDVPPNGLDVFMVRPITLPLTLPTHQHPSGTIHSGPSASSFSSSRPSSRSSSCPPHPAGSPTPRLPRMPPTSRSSRRPPGSRRCGIHVAR
ncbi:uncharacterized protein B0H18DRAFT_1034905 [Fomitopsis serialis]|uniref:uncharacterized protein n=1 Tax=Fomitopsis serialis TaxID=139415 RepID=UPI002007A83E|nr:uncharacterized protein B0H18DRAFT_1034905 [Neoantrodia serialis]KAH9917319.1 hypothetical protein B0H18DRAFT_1034905 [Neoantrodia serialis]